MYQERKIGMEKVVLKNGEEIEIVNGATENCITVEASTQEKIAEIVGNLTEENLEEYKILNSAGLECATIENKYVDSYTVYPRKGHVQFNLADVDMVAKRLTELETTQEMQDVAISELAETATEGV